MIPEEPCCGWPLPKFRLGQQLVIPAKLVLVGEFGLLPCPVVRQLHFGSVEPAYQSSEGAVIGDPLVEFDLQQGVALAIDDLYFTTTTCEWLFAVLIKLFAKFISVN